MAEIKLKHIHKRYENAEDFAVTDFNLDIQDNEFIVFVGPSGCGKSTTLRMIAGLEEITEGDLYIDADVVNDVAPKDRDIAMVFQNYALYPHMTVFDNMAFGLKLRKMPKDEIKERVDHAAEMLGLTDLLDRKPAALSGGQRQRVALGRAVVRSPKVFLMDEPLSNLDAKLRVHMRTEIAKLHEELETTMIYVTHDQTEAMTLADRIVIMEAGVIQQVGSPFEVYNSPNNAFVASFIGSPAMNLHEVTYSQGRITGKGIDLAVSEPSRKELDEKGYEGKTVIFGIRPEDIHSEQIALDTTPETVVETTITVAELTGAESILYIDVGGTEMVAVVDARDFHQAGETMEVAFNMNKAHFFDVETEEVIRKKPIEEVVETTI
ncbi:multiple sugar transport system ATP-binding protein [Atopostipes suicloacalis DSM 15692]|uniref:Multiple sugar transport system ATP-binding protein n=1 Tax=Atopostipes suicloacalis DSM 15692 TaxID=1121025 RepID=A0A1M4XGJ3_9LACT|nr:sn-glycerol-3-phosphate ABC transporter ATP-binding protein UgpC [Atopostipes suicloacalis]SHE92619.1 multiple sugar transport system ATP-binding protein [Atopostipes suicloacalis DSM 15692]